MRAQPRAFVPFVVVPLALAMTLGACSDDDGGTAVDTAVTSPATVAGDDAAVPSEQTTVQDLMAQVPSSAIEGRGTIITAVDLDAASEQGDIVRPGPDVFGEELAQWGTEIQGYDDTSLVAAPQPPLVDSAEAGADTRADLGWSVGEVTSYVDATSAGDVLFALETDTVTPQHLDETLEAGATGRWTRTSDQDPTPLTLALDDGELIVSTSATLVDEWVDQIAPLADNEHVMAIAGELDTHGVYAAMVTDRAREVTAEVDPAIPTLGGYDSVGAGLRVDDGSPTAVLVYHYPSTDEASAAVEHTQEVLTTGTTLRPEIPGDDVRPLSEIFGDVQVTAAGPLVVVTARVLVPPLIVWQLFMTGDVINASSAA